MSFEIEKKYRLTTEQRARVLRSLELVGARFEAQDFEENILYLGGILSLKGCILRLRKTQDKTVLTYKESLPVNALSDSEIKRRIEHETLVTDAAAMQAILASLGYQQSLVYEKRRQTWTLENVEIVIDELPFGLFMEIEAAEDAIIAAEIKLGIEDLAVESVPYPALAARFGKKNGNLIEARFV